MHLRRFSSFGALAALVVAAPRALAATGVCDVSPGDTGTSELACVAAIEALGKGTVVADIFKDANGRTGDELLFGRLVDAWGGCGQANTVCNGDLSANPGAPASNCVNASKGIAEVAPFVAALDWKYANPARLHDGHGFQAAPNEACPDWSSVVADGNQEGYAPWEGMVFDLGGPSNKVALFPLNDHGPQPCESIEYTVYLTGDPLAREILDDPAATGADPKKWNRAKLSRIFLEGWKKSRSGADPGLSYTIEADSFTSVWTLPGGVAFRYVGVIAGNDGKQLPQCNFDSYDAEIDAVAGLSESGAGVCPDADEDGWASCACATAPALCDCDDANPAVFPDANGRCGAGGGGTGGDDNDIGTCGCRVAGAPRSPAWPPLSLGALLALALAWRRRGEASLTQRARSSVGNSPRRHGGTEKRSKTLRVSVPPW